MKCTHSVRTDVGRHREHNEDDHGVGEGVQVALHGHLFVVCDGMGGMKQEKLQVALPWNQSCPDFMATNQMTVARH